MPVAPVAVLNIVIYMLKRICTWEKNKIQNRNTPMGTEGNPTMVNCKKAMLVRATTLLLSFWDAKFLKLHLPDGWFLMGKLPWFFFWKVWSLKVSDSKIFEDLTTFSLLSWGICEVQRNIPSFLRQIIRKLCSQCQWYHACGLANLFLSLMSSCSYYTNSSSYCIVT